MQRSNDYQSVGSTKAANFTHQDLFQAAAKMGLKPVEGMRWTMTKEERAVAVRVLLTGRSPEFAALVARNRLPNHFDCLRKTAPYSAAIREWII
jgi:hypothetical protein